MQTDEFNPKNYFINNRTLKWGENLSQDTITAMNKGEIFILLDINNIPYSKVLKDSYGNIRENKVI